VIDPAEGVTSTCVLQGRGKPDDERPLRFKPKTMQPTSINHAEDLNFRAPLWREHGKCRPQQIALERPNERPIFVRSDMAHSEPLEGVGERGNRAVCWELRREQKNTGAGCEVTDTHHTRSSKISRTKRRTEKGKQAKTTRNP